MKTKDVVKPKEVIANDDISADFKSKNWQKLKAPQ